MLPQGIPFLATSTLNDSLELRVTVAASLPGAPRTPQTHSHTLCPNPRLHPPPYLLPPHKNTHTHTHILRCPLCLHDFTDRNPRGKSSVSPAARGERHLNRKPIKAAFVYLTSRLISVQKYIHTHTLTHAATHA